MPLKDIVKKIMPCGIVEYSIRRHEYMRLGFHASKATSMAFSAGRHRRLCDTRLNLVPTTILGSLRTCVDAGAHRGDWTQTLLDHFNPERVIAVECEPRMLGRLMERFDRIPAVRVVDAALADSGGAANFHQLRHPAGSSLLKSRLEISRQLLPNSWDEVGIVKVQRITYDQLVADESEISILKLDIQGAEMGMLTASQEGLKKTKCIIMEVTFTSHYEGDSGFAELHPLMARKGFGLFRLSPPYERGGRALYSDAVYLREEILSHLGFTG